MWSSAAAMIDGRACKGIFAGGGPSPGAARENSPTGSGKVLKP